MEAEATEKTETQLETEIASLLYQLGARTYARTLLDREIVAIQERLVASNVELHNRKKARASIEAELAAKAEAAPAAPVVLDGGRE